METTDRAGGARPVAIAVVAALALSGCSARTPKQSTVVFLAPTDSVAFDVAADPGDDRIAVSIARSRHGSALLAVYRLSDGSRISANEADCAQPITVAFAETARTFDTTCDGGAPSDESGDAAPAHSDLASYDVSTGALLARQTIRGHVAAALASGDTLYAATSENADPDAPAAVTTSFDARTLHGDTTFEGIVVAAAPGHIAVKTGDSIRIVDLSHRPVAYETLSGIASSSDPHFIPWSNELIARRDDGTLALYDGAGKLERTIGNRAEPLSAFALDVIDHTVTIETARLDPGRQTTSPAISRYDLNGTLLSSAAIPWSGDAPRIAIAGNATVLIGSERVAVLDARGDAIDHTLPSPIERPAFYKAFSLGTDRAIVLQTSVGGHVLVEPIDPDRSQSIRVDLPADIASTSAPASADRTSGEGTDAPAAPPMAVPPVAATIVPAMGPTVRFDGRAPDGTIRCSVRTGGVATEAEVRASLVAAGCLNIDGTHAR